MYFKSSEYVLMCLRELPVQDIRESVSSLSNRAPVIVPAAGF
jgi:hypothetical protein